MVAKHKPAEGELKGTSGYYVVTRKVSKGITTYSGNEYKNEKEGDDIKKAKGFNDNNSHTFCNLAATVIAVAYGAPNLVTHKSTMGNNVNAIIKLLKNHEYDTDECMFQKVNYEEAQDYASRGGFAFAIKGGGVHGHIATLIGGYKDNDVSEANINTFQAGKSFGYKTVGDPWGKKPKDVAYYIWRRK